jgi:hypothetical protein
MKKITMLLATTFVFVMLAGQAFAWSDRGEGRPNQPKFTTPGIAVWHNRNNEFHIKSTAFRGNHVFTGIIQTDGRFYDIAEKELEGGDYVKADRDHNTIRFRLTGRGIDAISFRVLGGDTVDFDLYRDGENMPVKEIFIGKNGWHPWHSNFYFER